MDFESITGKSQSTANNEVTPDRPGRGERHGEHPDAKPPLPALPDDPDFRAVAEAWPSLPAALKAGILAMVKATGAAGKP